MDWSLEGRKALVTGATRGIGYSIANNLTDRGAEVIGTGRTDSSSQELRYEILPVDFSLSAEEKQFNQFVELVKEIKPDILINNAGTNIIGSIRELSTSDFEEVLRVNLVVPFMLSQAVVEPMCNNGWGRILNVSSIWGKIGKQYRMPYAASKFALDGMNVALAAEVSRFGVLCNCIAPGFVDTELTRRILGREEISTLSKQIPIERLGTPEEVAKLAAWLVSDENSYVTGQNFAIDGGFTRV